MKKNSVNFMQFVPFIVMLSSSVHTLTGNRQAIYNTKYFIMEQLKILLKVFACKSHCRDVLYVAVSILKKF